MSFGSVTVVTFQDYVIRENNHLRLVFDIVIDHSFFSFRGKVDGDSRIS